MIHVYILAYGLLYRPKESLAGLGITAVGWVVYEISRRIQPKTTA